MASVFVLLTLLVQMSIGMSARSIADSAVAASARRAALENVDPTREAESLLAEVASAVPGAIDVVADVIVDARRAIAQARFTWVPPGPILVPLKIGARAEVPRATPP
jgi:fructose-specific component phosphotransferase system IIB-like protein